MKKFQILRYIKNLRYLIIFITILGCLAIYMYVQRNQKYTAEIVIKYTNPTAKYGLAPDGNPIEPKDIYSAAVITDVKSDLNLNANIDQIRSACSVEEVISEDEERRKKALLDDGEEYNEVCTVYRVKYQVNSTASKDYARNVLDSIINNYYVFYSQKYIDSAVIPNNSLNISAEKYDYIDCVEILDKSIDEISRYLGGKASYYPTFRSSRTGYSFKDIQNEYNFIKKHKISEYYATVLGGKLTRDSENLVRTYQNRRDKDIIEITNLDDHIKKEGSIIKQFGNKVTKSDSSVAGAIGDNTDAIIRNVEEYEHRELDVDTTYDDLITYYVNLKSKKNIAEIDRDYCKEILNVFAGKGVENSIDTIETNALIEDMNETILKLNELYDILEKTSNEINEYSAAKNIKALSGVYVEEKINADLYLLMGFILFFIVGCMGAVVIGRGVDLWEYIVYIDKKVGIANRVRCDMVIDEYAKHLLPENFTCIVFKMRNLYSSNAEYGHNVGDAMLNHFGKFLDEQSKDYGFVGYNNSNMFIALFEECSRERANTFVDNMERAIAANKDENFDIIYGVAESTTENIYEIRQLLKKAIDRTFEN